MKRQLITDLTAIIAEVGVSPIHLSVEYPTEMNHGDFTTNIALICAREQNVPPHELAQMIAEKIKAAKLSYIADVHVAGPGFINMSLTQSALVSNAEELLTGEKKIATSMELAKKRIMVEYAHPNTHKEMHIGHMRTLITGESLARLLEAGGAEVFRANYQGDIGPHVAKALYGVEVLLKEKNLKIEALEQWTNKNKAHFLGEAYVRGNSEYEAYKDEIDAINDELYMYAKENFSLSKVNDSQPLASNKNDITTLYHITRQWSLDYYDDFYKRFSTQFDRLFFESEMTELGKKLVLENLGDIFTEDNGAVIFPGEKYGLHTRVFITQAGHPTYEAKDICNAFKQFDTFAFNKNIHVVASEQAGYFQVVFKALELIDPEKFKDTQYHLSMGMVQLSDRKMSSRTGDILTVDWLLDQLRTKVEEMMQEGKIEAKEKEKVIEQIVIGAVKYSVLKVGTGQDVAFDIARSVSLEGDSGPYLQYTYARTQSVLAKSKLKTQNSKLAKELFIDTRFDTEEMILLRLLYRFDDTVLDAAEKYSPNALTTYLFDLAQQFNLFYQKLPILRPVISRNEATRNPMALQKGSSRSLAQARDDKTRDFRLALTAAVGKTLQQGLSLLGIEAPERM